MSQVSATLSELVVLCRVSERTAKELAARGVFVRLGRGRYDRDASVGTYIDYLREVAAGRGSDEGKYDLVAERARLAKEQADGAALKNATSRGEMINAEEAERAWAEVAAAARSRILAIPTDTAQALPHLTKHDIAAIDRLVRNALDDASRTPVVVEQPEEAEA